MNGHPHDFGIKLSFSIAMCVAYLGISYFHIYIHYLFIYLGPDCEFTISFEQMRRGHTGNERTDTPSKHKHV
jgi:hypothetical protein